ncbi:MAG: hypothetical protein LBR74_09900 [Eubacterium sp.]|jgi:hypothetical protein|nr:hypothetical protein [Eubacterium sp.]
MEANGYILDSLAVARLEELSKEAQINQQTLLEELISACFSEACDGYQYDEDYSRNKGFKRFLAAMNYRVEIAKE